MKVNKKKYLFIFEIGKVNSKRRVHEEFKLYEYLAYKSTGGSPLLKKQKKFRVGRAYLGLHVAPGLVASNIKSVIH